MALKLYYFTYKASSPKYQSLYGVKDDIAILAKSKKLALAYMDIVIDNYKKSKIFTTPFTIEEIEVKANWKERYLTIDAKIKSNEHPMVNTELSTDRETEMALLEIFKERVLNDELWNSDYEEKDDA